jgi:hypothetical protein
MRWKSAKTLLKSLGTCAGKVLKSLGTLLKSLEILLKSHEILLKSVETLLKAMRYYIKTDGTFTAKRPIGHEGGG